PGRLGARRAGGQGQQGGALQQAAAGKSSEHAHALQDGRAAPGWW
ncbi:hypothetical protein HMPREF0731_4248, partial [Pseudoroseomonas cervicalis ATCC 49957]